MTPRVLCLLGLSLLGFAPLAEAQQAGPAPTSPRTVFQLDLDVAGEWRIRLQAMSQQSLLTTPGRREPTDLGQELFLEQWIRLTPSVTVNRTVKLALQLDIARALLFGSSARQVEYARDPRSTNPSNFPYGPVDLRELYLEWSSPIGIFRVGQQSSHWGMGMVANDGNHRPSFGDYRYGDLVERVAFVTRPLGPRSDLVIALAGDLVYRDRLARLTETKVATELNAAPDNARTLGGDLAFQAIGAVLYQPHACTERCEAQRLGLYGVYRNQRARDGRGLELGVVDAAIQWDFALPGTGARWQFGAEGAVVFGHTSLARDALHPDGHTVLQYGALLELGLHKGDGTHQGDYDFRLETGIASGDENPWDSQQNQFQFSPDHRIGMVLFPEILAWQSARSAAIAGDARLAAQSPAGLELLPTNGAVSGASYLYHTARVRPFDWLELQGGLVLAMSSAAPVDPTQSFLRGSPSTALGRNADARDLGLELDGGASVHWPLMQRTQLGEASGGLRLHVPRGIMLEAGLHGGVLFPGRALQDATGAPMGLKGVVQFRLGLGF